jgi:hypothetical protein
MKRISGGEKGGILNYKQSRKNSQKLVALDEKEEVKRGG